MIRGFLSPVASWLVVASIVYVVFRAAFWVSRKL